MSGSYDGNKDNGCNLDNISVCKVGFPPEVTPHIRRHMPEVRGRTYINCDGNGALRDDVSNLSEEILSVYEEDIPTGRKEAQHAPVRTDCLFEIEFS